MEPMKIYRWQEGRLAEIEDLVAEEAFLRLRINGQLFRRVAFSPEDVHAFVVGHLVAEGLISSPNEIKRFAERREDPWVFVDVEVPEAPDLPGPPDTLGTACGAPPAGQPLPQSVGKTLPFALRGKELLRLPLVIKDHVEAFTATGAYHYAFLLDAHLSIQHAAKDIGRHNAVDKVTGKALLAGSDVHECLLYLTGRLSHDVVAKCLQNGIPLAVSKAAPLTGAIALARKHGLGLIGFLRGQRFNIYSRPDLIS